MTSQMQNDLVEFLRDRVSDTYAIQTFDHYSGQLAVDDVRKVALNMPAVLVFYQATEYTTELQERKLNNAQAAFEILVCSNNIASRESGTDEILTLKDAVIDALKGTVLKIDNRSFTIVIMRDRILIREQGLAVCGIVIVLKGLS